MSELGVTRVLLRPRHPVTAREQHCPIRYRMSEGRSTADLFLTPLTPGSVQQSFRPAPDPKLKPLVERFRSKSLVATTARMLPSRTPRHFANIYWQRTR